jgi:hypothetical protein
MPCLICFFFFYEAEIGKEKKCSKCSYDGFLLQIESERASCSCRLERDFFNMLSFHLLVIVMVLNSFYCPTLSSRNNGLNGEHLIFAVFPVSIPVQGS